MAENFLFCSFFTADDYYRGHALELKESMARLGVDLVLQEIEKKEGEEWPDICRKKVPFFKEVCDTHPDRSVFWIDVDCRLISVEPVLRNFSADLLGFQRGFSSPMTIGYAKRTRFWEPCLFGVNSTINGRRFVELAAERERDVAERATDDYFFEEAWRALSDSLSFQILPSASVAGKGKPSHGVVPFFTFGESGHVAEFKGAVLQHGKLGGFSLPKVRARRPTLLRIAKAVEKKTPRPIVLPVRRLSDSTGLTSFVVAKETADEDGKPAGNVSRHRKSIRSSMLSAGLAGDTEKLDLCVQRLATTQPLDEEEQNLQVASRSFAKYHSAPSASNSSNKLNLCWWSRPFPGNYGDWLSPLILRELTQQGITYVAPSGRGEKPTHLVAVGSIGRFACESSLVVGAGVSSRDQILDPKARFISVRGPITAMAVEASGGPRIDSFGDPALLLRRIFPSSRDSTNGKTAFVRHFAHRGLPVLFDDTWDELSIQMSDPQTIEQFIGKLLTYDSVVTSAMHVLITCQSFGVPCELVTFRGFETLVHGNGDKYTDYYQGAGMSGTLAPRPLGLDCRGETVGKDAPEIFVSDEVLDEISRALQQAVQEHNERELS